MVSMKLVGVRRDSPHPEVCVHLANRANSTFLTLSLRLVLVAADLLSVSWAGTTI